MKLLVICQYFYPEQFRVSDVCFKLAAMGYEITVLTGLPNYPKGNIFHGYEWDSLQKDNFDPQLGAYIENIQGVRVIRCNLYPRKKGKLGLCKNYLSFLYEGSRVALKMIRFNLADFDKYLVFQFSPVTMAIPGILLKMRLHKPLFLYCFDLWPESIISAGLANKGILYNCLLLLSKWIYKKADLIIVSSNSFKKYFKEKLRINRPITYLPIYAEELFSQIRLTSNLVHNKDKKEINLVFAGNIGEMQSIDTIISAAHRIKEYNNIHIHIVGDGSSLAKCLALVKELNLENITFHGRHPIEDMAKYYDLADAFLVTLKRDPFISYTLPGKVQSYMAAGKPILAAIDGETYETILHAGCGLCCPAEDSEALAEIILKFSFDKNNHRFYGSCSKEYYKANFGEESFFNSLIKIISD